MERRPLASPFVVAARLPGGEAQRRQVLLPAPSTPLLPRDPPIQHCMEIDWGDITPPYTSNILYCAENLLNTFHFISPLYLDYLEITTTLTSKNALEKKEKTKV